MIIRKPYAFLIKYFKLIHIILFFLLIFCLFKTRAIYFFFRNYLATGTYLYTSNMASSYVGVLYFIVVIILIGMFLLIFLLMRQKKKPIFYYVSALGYSALTFISLIIFNYVYTALEYNTFSNQALVLLRDLSMVLYYLDYFFLSVAFIRGFGFNIKKFNFEKDLKELDITDSDREEIELKSSLDYDKITNTLRRKKRDLSYYVKENSYILTVFLVIFFLSLTAYISLNKLVINKVYKEEEVITIDKLDFLVNNSYISSYDYDNKIIKKDKKFIVIDFNITNNYDTSVRLDIENTRLKIDDEYYYPKFINSFSDIGTTYKNQSIKSKTMGTYLLIFELSAKTKVKNAYLEIYAGKKEVNNQAVLIYKEVKINPKEFNKSNIGTYNLNELATINTYFFKDAKFNISKYELLEVSNYTYTKCGSDDVGTCVDYNASVVPGIGKVLLNLEYSFSDSKDIFKFINIKYTKNNKEYYLKNNSIKNITPSNYPSNSVVLECSKEILDASKIVLNFNMRGVEFDYVLK